MQSPPNTSAEVEVRIDCGETILEMDSRDLKVFEIDETGGVGQIAEFDSDDSCPVDFAALGLTVNLELDACRGGVGAGSVAQWGTVVSPGAMGARVASLQAELAELGLLGPNEVTGVYDGPTRAAVIRLQRSRSQVASLTLDDAFFESLGLDPDPRLTADGFGESTFGDDGEMTVEQAKQLLGEPALDREERFSIVVTEGERYTNGNGSTFPYEFARTVCFTNGFCLTLGYDAHLPSAFVGYSQREPASDGESVWRVPALMTATGIEPGDSFVEHREVLEAPVFGCLRDGSSREIGTRGPRLVLYSDQDDLLVEREDGGYEYNGIDEERLTIVSLEAGDNNVIDAC